MPDRGNADPHSAASDPLPPLVSPDRSPSVVRVVLVEQWALVRHGLRALLRERGGYEVVGESGDGSGAASVVARTEPDIVLLGLSLPSQNGLTVLRTLRHAPQMPRVIIVTQHADPALAAQALAGGARGFVPKGAPSAELFVAMEEVLQGREYISGLLNPEAVAAHRRDAAFEARPQLTTREHEVLRLIATGASSGEVAAQLAISPHTAVRHRANLMRKLGAHNRVELLRKATALALVS